MFWDVLEVLLMFGRVSPRLAAASILALLVSLRLEGCTHECPLFGTNQSTALSPNLMGRRVFMNFGAPSQCRGTVTGWKYCYYRNGDFDFDSDFIQSDLVVFRGQDDSHSFYRPVPGSVTMIKWDISDVNQTDDFNCVYEKLDSKDYFEIRENDIVGACTRGMLSLIVTSVSSDASHSTYGTESVSCTFRADIISSELNPLNDVVIHVYADIAIAGSCTVGDNPPPSVAVRSRLRGTYLNTQYPVTCGNYITTWHYCYYTEAAELGTRLSMTVAVWSLDTVTNKYIVLPNSVRTIEIQPVQRLAKIFCVEESLNHDEYISVSNNSIIGVHLPVSNAIPIIGAGSNSDKFVLRNSQTSCLTSNSSVQDYSHLQGTVMHLYATITDYAYEPNMVAKPRVLAGVLCDTDNLATSESNDLSIATGVIAVISILVLLQIGTIAFVILVFVFVKKQRIKKSKTVTESYNNTCSDSIPLHDYALPMDVILPYSTYIPVYSTLHESKYESHVEINNMKAGNLPTWPGDIYQEPADNERDIYVFLEERKITNIKENEIVIGEELGSGQFGKVYKGQWTRQGKETKDVAIKTLNASTSDSDRVNFLKEAATMAQFRHPNVAALYGITEKNNTTMIVEELLSNGDLRHYLHTLQPESDQLTQSSTPNMLLHFSQQICLGMNYLSTTGYVHRDLAARNVLLSSALICKVADFGMSRNLHDEDYYTSSGGMVPVKWTAPEALQYKKYSTASDVWSYGCVLYEIWSLGHKPFEEKNNTEILKVIDSGYRLAPPPGCPKKMYEIMMTCWAPKPTHRPSFKEMLLSMIDNENVVIHIPPDDADSHPQAATLGAPLKAGYKMYKDLQLTYN